MLFTPLPLSQTVTPSRTPFPLERDVLYGRPLDQSSLVDLYYVMQTEITINKTESKKNPRQQKFRAMNGAHLASPIRGELGYAHWPQLGSQIPCPFGNQIWGPLGKEYVCPNGWQICVQQFGQL